MTNEDKDITQWGGFHETITAQSFRDAGSHSIELLFLASFGR